MTYTRRAFGNAIAATVPLARGENGMNLPWGQGDTPIKAALKLLAQKRYAIPAMIEWEYQVSGKSLVEVPKCVAFVKAGLA